jgi:hypothetical protein
LGFTVRREVVRGSGAAQDARCLVYRVQFRLKFERITLDFTGPRSRHRLHYAVRGVKLHFLEVADLTLGLSWL